VKHHILLQDYDSQAAAAEPAEDGEEPAEDGEEEKKNTQGARLYIYSPHKTAKTKKLSISYQVLLQYLLTLLRQVSSHALNRCPTPHIDLKH
jgi:hypothetical protein